MSDLFIGCPISRRDWIVEEWIRHARNAAAVAGYTARFLFVGDPESDKATFQAIGRAAEDALVCSVEDPRPNDLRRWNPKRYERMVHLRNVLLGGVRAIEPEMFLSLDSDILLHPDAITALVEQLPNFGAVGGKCFLSRETTKYPNYAMLSRGNKLTARRDSDGAFRVDVLMAIKLMSPAAYNVDYRTDMEGEDVGWAKACRAHGVSLGWVGTPTSKHVMAMPGKFPTAELLHEVDPRLGW